MIDVDGAIVEPGRSALATNYGTREGGDTSLSDDALMDVMLAHPILIN